MPAKSITLQRVADLIDDLKADFNAKHKENVDRRHQIVDKYSELEGRVAVIETQMRTVIGDNSGGSGLLHDIDRKVDTLTGEIAAIKKTVEDTPKINKWVYGAIAVVGFLVVVVPIVIGLFFEMVKVLLHH